MSEIAENITNLPASGTSEEAKADTRPRSGGGSRPIWNRALLLFTALCVIKFVMLFDLRRHLFELHWRIGPEEVIWANYAAFYVFALLVGLNLWMFSLRCERGGVRVVRGANACILVLGALFILLTFSEQGDNYVCALINNFLDLKDIGAYLYDRSCFDPPYLALWVLGYAFLYYGMARKGREYLMLRVTAVFAMIYIALCLGNEWYREILFVVDSIGISMLIGAWVAKRSLNLVVPGFLLVFIAFFFALFRSYDWLLTLEGMNREFLVLSICNLVLFAGITLLARSRGYFAAWSWILPFAFTAFLLFSNTNYVQAHNYVNFLCVGLTLPRYFLSELGITTIWFAIAWLYRWTRPKGSLLWLDIVLWTVVVFGLLDLRLTQIMAVRLDWQVLSVAFGETPKMMWRMSRPYLPALTVAIAILVLVYIGLLAMMRRLSERVFVTGDAVNGDRRRSSRMTSVGSIWFVLGFILLGISGIKVMQNDKANGQALTLMATTSPLWQHAAMPVMDAEKFSQTARELGIWQSPADALKRPAWQPLGGTNSSASGSARDMNVVIIFQESTYNKHLSLFDSTNDTEPLLSQYKDRMELFPNFYSSFAASINARFAAFSGLYPVDDFNAFTTHHVPVKSLFEALHDAGYSNSLFYSSYFDYTGFRDFLRGRQIEELHDADTMPGNPPAGVSWGLREDETLGAITNQIKKFAAAKQKFSLTYVPAAPHNPFDGIPERFKKYPRGDVGDYSGSYLNELIFMDWIVSSIVDQLKDSGLLDNTLIVITGDHGEMLGENKGPAGHGWAFTPELQNVPLILLNPKRPGYRINDALGSQVDMLPTILDLLGIPLPAGQLYQGTSLYSANADPGRTIYLNTFLQYGVFRSGYLFQGEGEQAGGCYAYTNEGPRTIFKELERAPVDMAGERPLMAPFRRFQANFLHNYSDYCRLARQSADPK